MIAELGNYALALSLAVSFFLAILPLWGAEKGHPQLMSLARPMTLWFIFHFNHCVCCIVLSLCCQ